MLNESGGIAVGVAMESGGEIAEGEDTGAGGEEPPFPTACEPEESDEREEEGEGTATEVAAEGVGEHFSGVSPDHPRDPSEGLRDRRGGEAVFPVGLHFLAVDFKLTRGHREIDGGEGGGEDDTVESGGEELGPGPTEKGLEGESDAEASGDEGGSEGGELREGGQEEEEEE